MPVSPEDHRWEHDQPVVGSPSLHRLAETLGAFGWEPLELALSDDGEFINFSLRGGDHQGQKATDREDAFRTLIWAFRQGGLCAGFTEVAIDAFDGELLTGGTLVGPLEEVCSRGPMQVDL